jgi:GH15 family glucan-1,4-alpha-glucosidase
MAEPRHQYSPIEDYGLIGNLHTTALVSKLGSMDYLPFPRFDSPTVFAGILDNETGGRFTITAQDQEVTCKQIYLPDTAVLVTRYLSDYGIAELTDFMVPVDDAGHLLLFRSLRAIKGSQTFKLTFQPRFNYGKHAYKSNIQNNFLDICSTDTEGRCLRLHYNHLIWKEHEDAFTSQTTLNEGEEVDLILEEIKDDKENARITDHRQFTQEWKSRVISFWKNWVGRSTYRGRWQDMVNRSAITLKLLTSSRYGSPIAAATLGLPEMIGGESNWDYRYSWIRDSSFTMYTFLQLGYNDEAERFIEWIQKRVQEIDQAEELKLMYRIDGSVDLEEEELGHLEGYLGSRPVRIGNAAFRQFQLDIYGELIDTIFIYNKNAEPLHYEFWLSVVKFIDFVAENWKKPDSGMWEKRQEKREYLISKVMSWVALDRGIQIARDRSFPAPIERWRSIRNEIFKDIFFNYWNPEKKAFVQYRGAESLDANALLIPMVRMLSPKEPRWISTLHAIENELKSGSLIYRYLEDTESPSDIREREGTFSMCSFWYAECLAKIGEVDRAIYHFEKILSYANHVGLYSEQLSMKGHMLGNFPQAFTHLALISAANKLRLLTEQGSLLRQQNFKRLT